MAQKKYDNDYKVQAVKLGREIGFSKAAKELVISIDTLYGWNKHAKMANLDLGVGSQTPKSALSLTDEVQQLRQQNRQHNDFVKEKCKAELTISQDASQCIFRLPGCECLKV